MNAPTGKNDGSELATEDVESLLRQCTVVLTRLEGALLNIGLDRCLRAPRADWVGAMRLASRVYGLLRERAIVCGGRRRAPGRWLD